MAIESVDLTQEGTSLSASGAKPGFVSRNYTAHYRVKTDNATTSPGVVEEHFRKTTSLPWFGRSWKWSSDAGNDKDTTSICKKIDVSYIPQSEGIFKVEATFEPLDDEKDKEKPNNGDGQRDPDPLQWREQINVSYTQISIPVMQAIFHGFTSGPFGNDLFPGTPHLQVGKTYVPQDSTLTPFDPLPEMELDITVLRMTRNIPAYDQQRFNGWQGAVNSDELVIKKPWLTFAFNASPLTARVKGISASNDFQNGIHFWRRDVEIWIHPNGWRGRLADMGHAAGPRNVGNGGFISPGEAEFVAAAARQAGVMDKKTIVDGDGFPATAPQRLNGRGALARETDNDVWSNWQYYHERPFAQFDW